MPEKGHVNLQNKKNILVLCEWWVEFPSGSGPPEGNNSHLKFDILNDDDRLRKANSYVDPSAHFYRQVCSEKIVTVTCWE